MAEHTTPTLNFRPLAEQELSVCKILIVDDEPSVRIILRSILQDAGYAGIEEIESGDKALKRIGEITPDLILMDVMMPGINGFDVCRAIKKDQSLQEIPIVFITALEGKECLVKGFEVGANDYLTKPFDENEVRVRVRNHLRLKKAVDKLRRYSCDLEILVEEESRELVKAERQAAFGQLIQGIIHDMNGPLTGIKAGIQTCLHTLQSLPLSDRDEQLSASRDTLFQSLEMVKNGCERLTEMRNRMMSRSRAESPGRFEDIDLNRIVLDEIAFLDSDLDFKHKFKKVIRLQDKPLTVRAIPSELSQVINNLIRNAQDALFGHQNPVISIETKRVDNEACLTLADNGPGIDPENIHRIFDPLFTTKPRPGDGHRNSHAPCGTGLGLYSCMQIIKSHQGGITVQSSDGAGAVFCINLPVSRS